jgi:hypothetical protein
MNRIIKALCRSISRISVNSNPLTIKIIQVMKTIVIASVILVIVVITAIKEDVAEAIFKACFYCSAVACCCVCAWVACRLRESRVKSIRENNRLRLERMAMGSKVIVQEMVTEYDYNMVN